MRAALIVVFAAGCTSKETTAPGDEAGDYVGSDALVDRAVLEFGAPNEQARFDHARACFAERGATWNHFPLRKIGNFIEEDWCRGPGGTRGCEGGGFRDGVDVDWAGVGTLHYDRDWPAVFGVQVDAGHFPADDWGVSASISTNGGGVLGDGTHVSFRRGDDEATVIHLGTGYAHDIGEATIVIGAGEPRAVLDTLRHSPAALRDEGISQHEALQAEVLGRLERGEVLECGVYGPYEGNGIPPVCEKKVPLPAEKVAAERARITAETTRVRDLLNAHHVRLHTRLVELLPDRCM
jgi:hypothetical protein